jgi:hypothetical protein
MRVRIIDAGAKYLAISFLLVFGSSAAQDLVDFQAYDAEQTFLSGIEHARS